MSQQGLRMSMVYVSKPSTMKHQHAKLPSMSESEDVFFNHKNPQVHM